MIFSKILSAIKKPSINLNTKELVDLAVGYSKWPFSKLLSVIEKPRCHPITVGLAGLAFSIISIDICRRYLKNLRELPPGPIGVPYLGYLPWILSSNALHKTYVDLCKKYGPVMSLKLGRNLVVLLGSPEMIHEYFWSYESSGRPHTPLNNLLKGRGVVLSEGYLWKQQRRYLVDKFRKLEVKYTTNQRFEKVLLREIKDFLFTLNHLEEIYLNPHYILGRHVHNIICQLMISFRFEPGDQDFVKFNKIISEGMRLYGDVHISEHIPEYLLLPGKAKVLKKVVKNMEQVSYFHGVHVKTRLTEERYPPKDLLDYYLNALYGDDEELKMKIFPGLTDLDERKKQVVQVMNDLFSAGMETSRTSLIWCLVMMLREPEVAERVREEIRIWVEPGELVTLNHIKCLPYTEATIYETLRRISVVPLGTTHTNLMKRKIGGYTIPVGAHVVPLINKVHMDPEVFPEPELFKPERFIQNGEVVLPKVFLPFGKGVRVCLGEQLARMELFLFFTNIMSTYEFWLPDGSKVPELNGRMSVTHEPFPFTLTFRRITEHPTDFDDGTNMFN